MNYEAPAVRDFGSLGAHTFINPGGDHKGVLGFDPFSEISDHSGDDGGS